MHIEAICPADIGINNVAMNYFRQVHLEKNWRKKESNSGPFSQEKTLATISIKGYKKTKVVDTD